MAESHEAGRRPTSRRSQATDPATIERPRRSSFRSKSTGAPARSSSSGANRDPAEIGRRLASETARKAWGCWAGMVLDRALLERRLRSVVAAFREAGETEEARLAGAQARRLE